MTVSRTTLTLKRDSIMPYHNLPENDQEQLPEDINLPEIQISYELSKTSHYINDSRDAFAIAKLIWDKDIIELQKQLYILCVGKKNRLLGYRCLHTGTMSTMDIDMRLIFAIACKSLAQGIIIMHNHSSGRLNISQEDKKFTKSLKNSADILGIELMDHLIVSRDSYLSYRDIGFL